MISAFLYRLYGWMIRLPGIGPRFDRWARQHRGLLYRVRDGVLRAEQALRRRLRAFDPAGAEVAQQLQDLAWMVQGLREGLTHLQQRAASDGGLLQRRLDDHQHAVNVKVDAALQAMLQRLERAERQLGQATVQAQRAPEPTRILQPAKLAAQMTRPEGVWLEVGCGGCPDPDRLNVDQRPLPGVDIVADAGHLPLPDGSVSDLRAAHLVEHFTGHHFVSRVLPEWWRVLAPGGTLRLITPDLHAMLAAFQAGTLSEGDLVHVLYGGQDYEGDFHYHAYSPASLRAEVAVQGFTEITIVAQGRRNGLCLEFELHARKPLAPQTAVGPQAKTAP